VTRAALLALALLLPAAEPATARYSPDVREARHWLRERTTDRGFRCLHILWDRESGWRVHARTPRNAPLSRAAYGIPQFYPGTKLPRRARHDATLQVKAGLRYIRARYGPTCRALAFQNAWGWY
jgi:hypothetical protein